MINYRIVEMVITLTITRELVEQYKQTVNSITSIHM